MPLIPRLSRVFKYTCDNKYSDRDIKRFISKIKINSGFGPERKCWKWKDSLDVRGYGRITIRKNNKRNNYLATRMAYEVATGKLIPEGLCVCHKCDNPFCVNIDHLWLGTNKDNVKDMINKGRGADKHGEKSGRAKLTWKKVKEIRKLYSHGGYTQKQLALTFDVSAVCIRYILINKTWYDKNYISIKFANKGNKFLTKEQVAEIRMLWNAGKYRQQILADVFGVTQSCINLIVNNKNWND